MAKKCLTLISILSVLCLVGCANQNRLAESALTQPEWKYRMNAVKRMKDQGLLAKVAVESKDKLVRSTAIAKIHNRDMLAKVAEEGGHLVQVAAIKKLGDRDQELLAHIALRSQDDDHLGAIEKLSDQKQLAKVAVAGQHGQVRLIAVDKLKDQSLLAQIARTDEDHRVRQKAVNKLSMLKQSVFAEIAQNDENRIVRKVAFQKLEKETLSSIVGDFSNAGIALAANIELGHTNWAQVIEARRDLDAAVTAAEVVYSNRPNSVQVAELSYEYIRAGDESKILALIFLLFEYGDKFMAEAFKNSGHAALEHSANHWADQNGQVLYLQKPVGVLQLVVKDEVSASIVELSAKAFAKCNLSQMEF